MYILPWLFLGNPQEFPSGQWLGLYAFTAMAWVQSLVGELRSCKSQSAAKKKTRINSQSSQHQVVQELIQQVIWEGHVYTAIFKMDNQQKPIV